MLEDKSKVRTRDAMTFLNLMDLFSDRISICWFGGVHIITRARSS